MHATTEQARESRYALTGPIVYALDGEDAGRATWMDVSRVGGAMALGRYLRPGRTITVEFTTPGESRHTVPAQIIWCEPMTQPGRFVAGFRIDRDDPESALRFAQLRYGQPARPNKGVAPQVFSGAARRWPLGPSAAEETKTSTRTAALPQAV